MGGQTSYTGFMTRRTLVQSVFIFSFVAFSAMACASPAAPTLPEGATRITGTAQFITLEGGFWAIKGDDGVTYDPKDGLPAAFQREGVRVTAVLKSTGLGGIHMVGPIVDILEIKEL